LQINESLVQYVRPGLPAIISPVGFGDRTLQGKVVKVNQYAEPSGWRQANVKEYKAFVSVDNPTPNIRAGMTASVTIRCAEVRDALQVPVQAIYSHGKTFYCFVRDGNRWEAREIAAGPTNDRFFVVEGGLQEGESVAMNPRKFVAEVDLPKLTPAEAQRAVPQPQIGGAESEAVAVNTAVPESPSIAGRPMGGPTNGFRPASAGQRGATGSPGGGSAENGAGRPARPQPASDSGADG
jgi:hypothetical protein